MWICISFMSTNKNTVVYTLATSSGACGPAAGAAPGRWLEMQTLKPTRSMSLK